MKKCFVDSYEEMLSFFTSPTTNQQICHFAFEKERAMLHLDVQPYIQNNNHLPRTYRKRARKPKYTKAYQVPMKQLYAMNLITEGGTSATSTFRTVRCYQKGNLPAFVQTTQEGLVRTVNQDVYHQSMEMQSMYSSQPSFTMQAKSACHAGLPCGPVSTLPVDSSESKKEDNSRSINDNSFGGSRGVSNAIDENNERQGVCCPLSNTTSHEPFEQVIEQVDNTEQASSSHDLSEDEEDEDIGFFFDRSGIDDDLNWDDLDSDEDSTFSDGESFTDEDSVISSDFSDDESNIEVKRMEPTNFEYDTRNTCSTPRRCLVSFSKTLITGCLEIPKKTGEEINTLFYSCHDLQRFEDDHKIEKKLKIEIGLIDDSDEDVQKARHQIRLERHYVSPPFDDEDW